MEINFGIVATTQDNEILHFVGFEEEPTQIEFDSLQEELTTDEEFGLNERDDWGLRHAFSGEVEYYRDILGDSLNNI